MSIGTRYVEASNYESILIIVRIIRNSINKTKTRPYSK